MAQAQPSGVGRRWNLSDIALGALATVIPMYAVWVLFVGSSGGLDPARYAISLLAYGLVGSAAVAFTYRASRLEAAPTRVRDGWGLLSAACILNWLGYLIYALLDDVLAPEPLPMIASGVFLGFYALAFAALPQFAEKQQTRRDLVTLLLDAAMVVIPGGMLLWRFIIEPVIQRGESDLWLITYSISFALCDLAVLAGLATLLLRPHRAVGRAALSVLALGMMLNIVGDLVFARLVLAGAYWSGALPNLFWITSIGLFALAADIQRRSVPASNATTASRATRAGAPAASAALAASDTLAPCCYGLLPYAAVAIGYAMLVTDVVTHSDLGWTFSVVAASLLTCCLAARQILMLRENERLLAERVRREGESRLSALVRYSRDVVIVVGQDGRMHYVSPSAERLLGQAPAALHGRSVLSLVHPADEPVTRTLLADVLTNASSAPLTSVRLLHATGDLRDCELIALNCLSDPSVQGVVVTCRDMTEHRAFERELTELAISDRLTGLPNRTLLLDRLGQALARAQRRRGSVATLLVDLDNFKVINDSLGHQTGDELLILVAKRVAACLRAEDTLARMGGDELGILLEDAADEAGVIIVAERLLAALSAPFAIRGQSLYTTASIGIALSSPAADQPASLLRNADLALYQAKARGKARWAVFDPGLNAAMRERLELETELRGMLEHGSQEHGALWVAYQPVVDLQSGTMCEVEALVRWQHPTHGLISPARFIPIAEETGLIVQIGRWVLEQACGQAVRWQTARTAAGETDPFVVGVNLSGRQLQDPGLVEMVAGVLADTGLDGAALKLELTESVVMESTATAIETLTRLKALGVRLAIDDFGTGYSSLAYLKRFPVDVLKIDRSFVAGLGRDAQDTAIVQGVIAMAQGLGMTVTAEGVETAEQAVCLKRLGCDLAQGYYYAQPLAADQVDEVVTVACHTGSKGTATPGRLLTFPERVEGDLLRQARSARPNSC